MDCWKSKGATLFQVLLELIAGWDAAYPLSLQGLEHFLTYAELDRVALDEDERQTFLDLLGIIERAAMEAIQPPTKT